MGERGREEGGSGLTGLRCGVLSAPTPDQRKGRGRISLCAEGPTRTQRPPGASAGNGAPFRLDPSLSPAIGWGLSREGGVTRAGAFLPGGYPPRPEQRVDSQQPCQQVGDKPRILQARGRGAPASTKLSLLGQEMKNLSSEYCKALGVMLFFITFMHF